MTAMVLFIFSLLPFILKAYNLSDLTAKTTADIIHFHGIGAIFIWPVAFSLPATFRAAGDAKACMYISSISMWIFRIGFSYVLGKYMGMGVFGIWVAMVIDWVFRAMCFVIRYSKEVGRKMRLYRTENVCQQIVASYDRKSLVYRRKDRSPL